MYVGDFFQHFGVKIQIFLRYRMISKITKNAIQQGNLIYNAVILLRFPD